MPPVMRLRGGCAAAAREALTGAVRAPRRRACSVQIVDQQFYHDEKRTDLLDQLNSHQNGYYHYDVCHIAGAVLHTVACMR